MLSTVDEPTRTSSGTNARNSANTFTDNLIYRMPATSEVTGSAVPVIGGVECLSKATFRQATILSEVGFTSEKLLPGSAEMRNHFFLKQDALNFNASYGTPVREVSHPCLRANNLALSTTLSHKNLTKISQKLPARFSRSNGCIRSSVSHARMNGCSQMQRLGFRSRELN